MKNAGVYFEIPNAYGSYLFELFRILPVTRYHWSIIRGAIHLIGNNEFLGGFLLEDEDNPIDGERLLNLSRDNTYYIMFATLCAHSQKESNCHISNYSEFIDSDCQLAVVIADCSEVMIICKDLGLVDEIYDYVESMGYQNVKYKDEVDLLTNNYIID